MSADTLGQQMGAAVRTLVTRLLVPLSTRLATVETRTGALALLASRGAGAPSADQVAEVERLLEVIRTLDARVKALEARPTTQYEGVWREGVGYERGAMVTHSGSVWHCNVATIMKPGTSDAWTLAVKRGKDAR